MWRSRQRMLLSCTCAPCSPVVRSDLPIDQSLRGFGIASALDGDPGRGLFDIAKVRIAKLDRSRAEVLFEPVQFRGPWNRHDPGLLREQPGECDLGRSR